MDADVKQPTSLTATLVWLVRLVLPFLLFWIWYRTQAQSASGKHVYSREFLLSVKDIKQEDEDDDVPAAVRSIRLAPDAQVQRVLGPFATRGGGGGSGGRGPQRGPLQRGGSGSSHTLGLSPQIDSKKFPKGAAPDDDDDDGAFGIGAAGVATGAGGKLTEKERQQHEALLNFVAFSYRDEPQRVFLSEGPPPPPPRRKTLPADVEAAQAKANAEAQVVLRGAVNPKLGIKSADVAKTLTRQMTESGMSPTEATYALMVEVCVNAGDLRGASDILMRMESAGHCADAELLDRVMDLYSKARGDEADGGAAKPQVAPSDED